MSNIKHLNIAITFTQGRLKGWGYSDQTNKEIFDGMARDFAEPLTEALYGTVGWQLDDDTTGSANIDVTLNGKAFAKAIKDTVGV